MVAQLIKNQTNLYDTDYHLWILETVKKLENGDFNSVDWENLIEEVLDLSERKRRKMESLLMRLMEHLLKLGYWELEKEKNKGYWQGEIRNFRKLIKKELKGSPSLKRYLQEIFEESYQDSREIVSDKSQLPLNTFPEKSDSFCCASGNASLEEILDENWLP